jgi:IS1 family transposase
MDVRLLNNEGAGISSMSRILCIPKTSVQMLLCRAARKVQRPVLTEVNQDYEVDEIYTFSGSRENRSFIIYAINRHTRQIIDFIIGQRTKENILKLLDSLNALSPRRIYTDRLPVYKSLIPAGVHRSFLYKTNHIERKNLTLRTHLKRLSRKTICFSKSQLMTSACLKLYAWS